MAKTFEEINEKIRRKEAVVVTAEEIIDIVGEKGAKQAAKEVDVVTTGTFGPMCSSGALINTGHAAPRIRIQKAKLNSVPAYGGIAAADLFIGATELPEDDPENKVFPGSFEYGGAHVIESLVNGDDIELQAASYGTDCYPRKKLNTLLNIKDLNNAILLNPRNCYQNYNVAVNAFSKRPIYTYLGCLLPGMANASFCSAGQLSPLLCDPNYRTIGIGTRIFLGGGTGYIFSHGTQHSPGCKRGENGVPMEGAGTIAVSGDLKAMSSDFLRAVSIAGYGVSLAVGIGIPIPILDEEIALAAAVRDQDIFAPVVDYSEHYPNNKWEPLAYVSYKDLRSGTISIKGKEIKTGSLSSYAKAREIALRLKENIIKGDFLLGKPVETLPGAESGIEFMPLKFRPIVK